MNESNQSMNSRVSDFIKLLDANCSGQNRVNLARELYNNIADTAEFEQVQTKRQFRSDLDSNPKLVRTRSKGGKDLDNAGGNMGIVPGYDGAYEMSNEECNKHFKRLCEKYCGM